MSSRARRITKPGSVIAFPWSRMASPEPEPRPEAAPDEAAMAQAQLDAVERDAYARGYGEGEAAGAAATGEHVEQVLRQLTQALQETIAARADMLRRTERQMVELALTLARRVVQREVAADQSLLLQMAKTAVERLGDETRITVRFSPHDFEAVGGDRLPPLGANVSVVADAKVERGECRVDSELGTLEAGIEAQIQELGRGLLGDEAAAPPLSNVA